MEYAGVPLIMHITHTIQYTIQFIIIAFITLFIMYIITTMTLYMMYTIPPMWCSMILVIMAVTVEITFEMKFLCINLTLIQVHLTMRSIVMTYKMKQVKSVIVLVVLMVAVVT